VNYVDYTLVRLADDSLRAALFDQDALAQLASVAFDAEAMTLGPPYSAVFDNLFMGLSVPRQSTVEVAWGTSTGNDLRNGRATLHGLGDDGGVRVDALWRGAVVANALSPMAQIANVVSQWTDTNGIDAAIVQATGSLPTDPVALEQQRRAQLLARLKAGFAQPDALSDAIFDAWLTEVGATSVGDLMTRYQGQLGMASLKVQFGPPGAATSAPRRLALSAAILIRDQPISVADLLSDSKIVRDQLDNHGAETAVDDVGAVVQNPIVVVWMVPDATFDDADWPGGEAATTTAQGRQLRRSRAGTWLAREGIGLVPTPAHP
jgi:hypothetical protein